MKKVIVTPYLFEDSLVISLSKDWIRQFGAIPKFSVKVDSRNRLVIESVSGAASK